VRTRAALTSLALATTSVLATAVAGGAPAAQAAPPRAIDYASWDTPADLATGRARAVRVAHGKLRLDSPTATARVAGRTYEKGSWTSPWRAPGFGLTELVPSWDAKTPEGTFVQVQVRARTADGRVSSWDSLGRWAAGDQQFRRSSQGSQTDDLGRVATDTWVATTPMSAWRLRVTLHRRAGTRPSPKVDVAGAVASAIPSSTGVRTSRPGVARGVVLPVPQLSQMVHQGHYPEYDAGGEAWCSPTSVSMVLGGLDRLPSPREYSWVPADHPDRWVDHAARSHFDYAYDGAGNWSFSAAYAATHADAAFVTRLRHLREAERFIRAGIPLVASVAFGPGELTGAPIGSTAGHLMVIIGFTEEGDVVVNDPAAPRNRSVQRVYDRREFETAWLTGSGGLVYVIRDRDQRLPRGRAANW
jgi:hypothetical protein